MSIKANNLLDSIVFTEENDRIAKKLSVLDKNSPFSLEYNNQVKKYINKYLREDKKLISKMLASSSYYFPLIEATLDKHGLPMELKYLAIVESGLNPKARSVSGATGLWQFMYLTGKQYNLEVNSYVDDRQDPLKSTESACQYFKKLYDIFGDWNLVLAAYNGGPGYIQRKIIDTGINDYWQLQKHLRTETRNYIPKFIAINYLMNFYQDHNIQEQESKINFLELDTIRIKNQIELEDLNIIVCVDIETINYLNPSYKKNIFPEDALIVLPKEAANDFLLNENSYYNFISLIENKQVLINEERVVYDVQQGDYLGKIAKDYNVRVYEIKKWNNLNNPNISVGDKLVLFVDKGHLEKNSIDAFEKKEYVIKKGDTLWGIAQKIEGVSVSKIKAINKLKGEYLKPGTKILIPVI